MQAASMAGGEVQQVPRATQQVVLPIIAADKPPASIHISANAAYQGGALRVAAENATSGFASLFGREYPLSGGESVAGFVGLGTEDPPGSTTLTVVVTDLEGEQVTQTFTLAVLATQWTVDYITIPPSTPAPPGQPTPVPLPDDNKLLPGVYAGRTPRRWTDGWSLPLAPPIAISGYFGEQRSFNNGPVQGHHGGTDFAAEAGTPILATNGGSVVMSGPYQVRGNLVVVDHGDGIMSSYGHMQERAVEVGHAVSKGDILGQVGSTGLSTGPHLHWELSVGGVLVDGLRWTDGSQGF
ncbi:MAG: peptidoglycan DD-metalloendopeptidase family protein [Gemmataceae bacterium]|nr:peptidoglycan DD-metalloendopeptidase family protein [Gemmataceae bacterium]